MDLENPNDKIENVLQAIEQKEENEVSPSFFFLMSSWYLLHLLNHKAGILFKNLFGDFPDFESVIIKKFLASLIFLE